MCTRTGPPKKYQNRKRLKRLCSLLACVTLCFSSSAFVQPAYAEDSVKELESRYAEIENEIAENKNKISAVEGEKTEQQVKVDAIKSEIDGLNGQIDILDDKIDILSSDIGELNNSIAALDKQGEQIYTSISETKAEIVKTQEQIDRTYDLIIDRMAASYMMGDASVLEFIIGSKSLSELLTWTQYLKNASDYDNELIGKLNKDIATLDQLNRSMNEEIKTLEATKQELSASRQVLLEKQADVQKSADELEGKRSTVDDRRREAVALLKTLDKQSEEYKQLNKQLNAEQERIEAQINGFLESNGSSSIKKIDVQNDGTLTWPVPYPNCYVESEYGARSSGMHRGIDICVSGGTRGKNIIAAQSGVVIKVGYDDPSMGNYVLLDHGNGLFTNYYHASEIKVSTGQKVEQGDVIALIGSTGNTTGPHLHFGVRVNENGTIVYKDPLNYVSIP